MWKDLYREICENMISSICTNVISGIIKGYKCNYKRIIINHSKKDDLFVFIFSSLPSRQNRPLSITGHLVLIIRQEPSVCIDRLNIFVYSYLSLFFNEIEVKRLNPKGRLSLTYSWSSDQRKCVALSINF